MESILKKPDLWENLRSAPYPIALYGTGNGADKIIDVLTGKGISFIGVFSSDGFVRPGKTFRGFPVLPLSELEKKYGRLTVLMCFGSARREVIENVKKIKEKHLFFAPDVPVYGDILFDRSFFASTFNRHKAIYDILADDLSKNTFESIVKYKLSGDIDRLFSCEAPISKAYKEILCLGEKETYLDLGAYRGDTVFEFIRYADGYKKIYAVEPDKKTFLKLKEATKDIKDIEYINACISDESRIGKFNMNGSRGSNASGGGEEIRYITVDDIIDGGEISFIKADVEGAELSFIKGARDTIINRRPKMMISCYHRSDDLYKIPEAVLEIRDDYKVYMRHFPSLPAWDTVYLFV